jgi:hypothetical protein
MKSSVCFRGKTWIYTANLLIFGFLGSFCIIMGVLFGTKTLTDANGDPRPQAAIPLLILGPVMLLVAGLALYQLIARRIPIISCFREGVVCNMIAPPLFPGLQYFPAGIRLVVMLFSGQGFRRFEYCAPWEAFGGAEIRGTAMSYQILLLGAFRNMKTNHVFGQITLRQVEFKDSPDDIAATINSLVANRAARDKLTSWQLS